MKVLFVGGTGNISTSASKLCIQNGIELFLLNRGNSKTTIEGAKVIKGDITDPKIGEVLKNHDWDSVVNWIAFTKEDIERDIKLFSGRTKQYIFISSASVYQKPPLHPIITESTPLYNPFWEYSRNKIACEELLSDAYRKNGFPATIVRPSHTYDTVIPVPFGGWTEYTIVDRIKKGKKIFIQGDGTSLWVITHAEDFAKGFVPLIGHQKAAGNAFHITSDEILTWNQVFEAIADAAGAEANIVHIPSDYLSKYDDSLTGGLLGDKSHSVIFDNSKIKTFVPGFNAVIPFNTGIKRTLKWFEAIPERMIINKETEEYFDKLISAYENGSRD
jgi:nucleoside-diphosphate-sugar epimerase